MVQLHRVCNNLNLNETKMNLKRTNVMNNMTNFVCCFKYGYGSCVVFDMYMN